MQKATDNVLRASNPESIEGRPIVRGLDLNKPENQSLDAVIGSFEHIGFSATTVAKGIEEVRRMLAWRLSDDPYDPDRDFPEDQAERSKIRCKIFLGYTSNLVSSGLREYIRFLVQHKLVDVVVSSAGGVEEDIIKCLAPTFLGDFHLSGAKLREESINRIGNLLVPNENYCLFEQWIIPIFDECLEEQRQGYHWTPSRLIWRLGERIADETSIAYWAWKNHIPIFCPAITDGSLGDMLFFHSHKNPGLIIDVVGDIRAMNTQPIKSPKNGCIILGSGVIKHHILNANLFAGDGADFALYINTAHEFDGSDAGASCDEAVSWGKISPTARPVKICADAAIVFPLVLQQTLLQEYLKEPEYWDGKKYDDPHACYWTQLEEEAKDPELQRRLEEARLRKMQQKHQNQ
ncbi:putative Deoxyhypusine synthase [Giardia muris]|uniref:Putative Deoxyhypusine synthase n=1 Tax=Giardia muris TaxID=5742 RepID=A0A4Z1SUM8_GIAMU|nr:putative Deoxyhypusine synthase [Giardia muris]|eukprot:TNJ29602.1 putative Deoxyhypusine synthase [Giardia muris]